MKPKHFQLLTLLLLAVWSSVPAYSQTLLTTLNRYNEEYPHEKMHVQFDKAAYSGGETVWFKAYLVSKNMAAAVSTNFHAELVDATGRVIEKKVYPIYESSAAGSFDLPQHLKGEGVLFRAYTTWMLNFDTTFIYTKMLSVARTGKATLPGTRPATTLRFFPEGGDWVATLPSVVAFKAVDEGGRPQSVSGVIKDSKGGVVTLFKTVHDGMGKVEIEPQAGTTYTAEWRNEKGQTVTTPLPAVKDDGITLQVKQIGNMLGYTIRRREDREGHYKKIYVVANLHQHTVYRAAASLAESSITSGGIPLKSLVSGIMQVTLFDEEWKPMAERIAFIDRGDDRFTSQVTWATKDLGKRGKNVLEVEVPDTLRANLSIAVTDAQVSAAGSEDIVSRLLLTSDLRGAVHNPAYYFSSQQETVKEHLDLLMLTHGWRRYNWQALAAGQLPPTRYPKEEYLAIRGNIYGIKPGEIRPNEQVNVFIMARDSSRQLVSIPIQQDGSFTLPGAIFFDTVKLYYQLNDPAKTARKAKVEFASQAYAFSRALGIDTAALLKAFVAPAPSRAQFFALKREEIVPELNRKIKTLQEVVVTARTKSREQELEKRYVSGLFQSGNSRSFNLVDDPHASTYQDAVQYLQGKVPGLQVYGSSGEYRLVRRESSPALYIDEMPAEIEDLTYVPVSDIALIKVFDPPFMGAFGAGAGGAIAVYTRKGGERTATSNNRGLATGTLAGYAPLKEFYAPDYATASPLHEVEDVRSTLYWNPYLLTDKGTRKIRIEFYNNDVSTSLHVVLEGMNEEGRMTRVEQVVQ